MKFSFTALLLLFVCATPVLSQQVTGLSNWSLYLDPGHSQTENMGIHNYSEPQKVLRVALYAKQMLEEQTDIDTVFICRSNDSQVVGLTQRTDDANTKAADFYHSIHSNAGAPQTNNVLTLWGAWYQNGNTSMPLVEKTPNGGKKMGDIMIDDMRLGMRLPSIGSWGDRAFYQAGTGNTWPYLSVNRESNMASVLTEGGFHTNPVQNAKNMNAEYKKLEAQTHFWSYLRYHGLARPKVGIVTGIISDWDSDLQINGATATAGVQEYTTDTFESLFKNYVTDPNLLRNGFYYLEDLSTNSPFEIVFSAPGYYNDTLRFESLNDTTFNYGDIKLVSSVKPFVASITPTANDTTAEPTDRVVIQFSRKMNRASVEAAFTITPTVSGNFVWADDSKVSFVPTQNLDFETTYTVRIAETAKDQFGHLFDGNNDGETGDAFEISFKTTVTDLDPPSILSFSPSDSDELKDPRTPISIVFSEEIKVGLSSSSFKLKHLGNGNAVTVRIKKVDYEDKTIMTLFPTSALEANASYEVTIESGLGDKYGNTMSEQTIYEFTVSPIQNTATTIDNFDTGIDGNWWIPQQSGSTEGIVTDLTSRAPETTIISAVYSNTGSSMRINYGWDTAASTHLIRQYLGAGAPFNARFTSDHTLQAYIFGDGKSNLFRFVVRDGNSQLEASPWYTVDWLGWKLVQWKMSEGAVGWVNGNGTIEGSSRFDSFQLSYGPNATASSGFYAIDDFAYASIMAVSNENDSFKPIQTSLEQNFPNPFNPSTTISFSLAKADKAKITVFDVLGREVAVLANQTFNAGNHAVSFDASSLSSGMYLYRLETNGEVLIRKMTLIK